MLIEVPLSDKAMQRIRIPAFPFPLLERGARILIIGITGVFLEVPDTLPAVDLMKVS
jgi:hypothetical protein